jgi:hypothetical protein
MDKSYGGRRSRVHIDVRAARANMCAEVHIQHRRPNGWADRGPNWYKHSLEQWAEVSVVGGRECAMMRALRAQTCAQHHTSSIGGQTAVPIGAQIGTNTHWGNVHKLLWGQLACATCARSQYAIGAAQQSRASTKARERARSAKVQGWNRAQHPPRARRASVGCARIARNKNKCVNNSCVFSDRHRC